jgi:DNA-binding NarL/FixJ family response regulator
VIDDDYVLREALIEGLQQDKEFVAMGASSISEGLDLLGSHDFEAMILNVGLPDGDGRDFCKTLRKIGYERPIMMLTGATDEADILQGLASGANDYMGKPFRLNELVARVRVMMRIYDESQNEIAISPAGTVLLSELDQAEEALIKLRLSRHGIGGNRPPEPTEFPRLAREDVEQALRAIQTARTEVLSGKPDLPVLAKCANALFRTSLVVGGWIFQRGQVGLDEAIKYFSRAAATGYALDVTDAYHKLGGLVHSLEGLIRSLH